MMSILISLCLLLAAALFIACAVTDFRTWKIPNTLVLAASAAYVPYGFLSQMAGWKPAADPLTDLGAAALLFVIGFAFWAVKLFGAGDAKLFFPVGLFTGWANLLPYALNLVLLAVVAFLLLKWPLPLQVRMTAFGTRLEEIRKTGKVPYGVVMVGALFLTFIQFRLPG